MAAAGEARAAWQRSAANRCFVQEDAKRAPIPKLPSSSSSLMSKQANPAARAPAASDDELGFIPPNSTTKYYSSHSNNVYAESRWWLQLQPNYMMMYQQLEAPGGISHQFVDKNIINMDDSQSTHDHHVNKAAGEEESYEFVEMDDCSGTAAAAINKNKNSKQVEDEFSLDYSEEFPHWMETTTAAAAAHQKKSTTHSHKEEQQLPMPWWRLTDTDDLASFVAQRSHDFMENCDLPQPQPLNTKRPSPRKEDHHEFLFETSTRNPQITPKCLINEAAATCSIHASCFNINAVSVSDSGPGPVSTRDEDEAAAAIIISGEMDESKRRRRLLEALCHSQTRAREAEKAANRAHHEKQHLLNLIFKQASHLFAYKQCLYLLQLQNLYNQINIFPPPPPSRNKKPRTIPANKKTPTPYKHHDDDCCCMGNYAVALAVGLGLVGAGLLLGWTVGWMFF